MTFLNRAALALLFFWPLAATAAPAEMPRAHPGLWRIENGGSAVYLFGSIHVLMASVKWHTPEVEAAMAKADSFAFETSLNFSALRDQQAFISVHGILPRGQFLHEKLSAQGLADYKTLVVSSGLDPNIVDHFRPWLASMSLGGERINGETTGVDMEIIQYAKQHKKPLRYLESLEAQMNALSTSDPETEIAAFEAGMRGARQFRGMLDMMTRIWITGDMEKLDAISREGFARYPGAEAAMLTNRNAAWVPQIEKMLTEKKTVLITVGAAHLSGSKSVIAMLCARGWRIERLTTGGVKPPAACNASLPALRRTSLR